MIDVLLRTAQMRIGNDIRAGESGSGIRNIAAHGYPEWKSSL